MAYEQTVKRVACDNCERTERIDADPLRVTLPPPWRNVYVAGWGGAFQACSDECEAAIRQRYERPPS